MTPKLTCMTNRRPAIIGARREEGSELAESFAIWMTEATVPEGGGGGGDQGVSGRRKVQRVERPGAIAHDHFPGQEILHRTIRRVKLHRTVVIGSELTNRNKILNKWR